MEKERTRRYASASELAADIERHLRDEPVLAGPPSAAYRASKFMRKHRGALAGALAAFLFLVVSLFGMTALNFVNAMQLQLDGTLRTEAYIRNQVSWLVRKAVARQPQLSIADALRHDEIELDLMQILAEAPAVLEIAICDQRNEILVDSDPARRYTFQVYPDFA